MKHPRKQRSRSEVKTARRNAWRMLLSFVLLLICAVPMLGGHVQPLPVIPAVICIAMNEEFGFTTFCAAAAGLLIDISCGNLLGANAIFLVIAAAAVWLLFTDLLRRGFLHWLLLTAAAVFLRAGLALALPMLMTRSTDRTVLWGAILLPSCILTMLTALIVYVLYLPCGKLLTKRVRSMDAAAIRRDW